MENEDKRPDLNVNELYSGLHRDGKKCPNLKRMAYLQAFLIVFIVVVAGAVSYSAYAYGEQSGFGQARDSCFEYVEDTKRDLWCDNPSGSEVDYNFLLTDELDVS